MDKSEPNQRLQIWVTGRVQGVGFRAFTARAAQTLGLRGWVRNLGYDQVEALAEGQRADLEAFAQIVRSGPRASRVDEFRHEWLSASGEFDGFAVRSSR
ncbi:MAG: acylphosphatase [Anaerolineales bacterium]|jgi:acylphosphatase|nr:acylphosphatase [Anaerolineales bacterium]